MAYALRASTKGTFRYRSLILGSPPLVLGSELSQIQKAMMAARTTVDPGPLIIAGRRHCDPSGAYNDSESVRGVLMISTGVANFHQVAKAASDHRSR
jgi:hypothetical protein